jgi:hypothetical protein
MQLLSHGQGRCALSHGFLEATISAENVEMPSHRSTSSFGKRQEYIAVAELLKRGYDVYMTLVDDQQIDCVVRFDGDPPTYIDLQIKARARTAKNPGTFSALTINKPRVGFFYVFYSELVDTYWVVPSLDFAKGQLGRRNKTGANAGAYSVVFVNRVNGRVRPSMERYKNRFDLLGPMSATTGTTSTR